MHACMHACIHKEEASTHQHVNLFGGFGFEHGVPAVHYQGQGRALVLQRLCHRDSHVIPYVNPSSLHRVRELVPGDCAKGGKEDLPHDRHVCGPNTEAIVHASEVADLGENHLKGSLSTSAPHPLLWRCCAGALHCIEEGWEQSAGPLLG